MTLTLNYKINDALLRMYDKNLDHLRYILAMTLHLLLSLKMTAWQKMTSVR